MIAHKCSVEHVGVARSRLWLAVGVLESTRYFFVRNVFGEGRVGFVCRGGLRRSGCTHTHTHTTPSPCGPDVWLLNWSDGLEGRSRHSRSHYSTLCSLTLGVCVCTSLTYNLWTHVTHALCVFCARFRRFGLLQRLACCWVLKNHLYCTHKHTHTQAIWTTWQRHTSCVLSLSSIKSPPTRHTIRSLGKKILQIFCMLLLPIGSIESMSN